MQKQYLKKSSELIILYNTCILQMSTVLISSIQNVLIHTFLFIFDT